MGATVHVESLQVYKGSAFSLDGPTALFRWSGINTFTKTSDWEGRLRSSVHRLCPADPLYDLKGNNLPLQLLTSDSIQGSFLAWGVALVVMIQRLARNPVGQGQLLSVSENECLVALPYQRENVLKPAILFAIQYLDLVLSDEENYRNRSGAFYTSFNQWLSDAQAGGVSPNTMRFAMAAYQRSMPVSLLEGVLYLGWGHQTRRMDSSFTEHTSNMAVRTAKNKLATGHLLRNSAIPFPLSIAVKTWEEAKAAASHLGWPVVIKPSNQDQGIGVVPGIRDEPLLHRAFLTAEKYSPSSVIVEKHITGDDYRMLVVGGKLIMTTKRIPGGITGDGKSTVVQLIDEVNASPLRGKNKRNMLISLVLDEEANDCLKEQDLMASSVPAENQFVRLRRTANISSGGTAVDMTGHVHADNRIVAERASRLVGLDIAGVDFLCPDISRSWKEVGGAVCEVNAQPGFRVHWLGDPDRDINGEVLDWLFEDRSSRIPTAAITGTNGKSTVSKMLHRIFRTNGIMAGVCTTQGIWIGDDRISDQNLSGFPGGKIMLNDPLVEAAIIELPRKGLIYFGHPCDRYDVAAFLNLQDDHLGYDGIHTAEEMLQLKGSILHRASKAVVLNADDPYSLGFAKELNGKEIILFTSDKYNSAIQKHRKEGGRYVWLEESGSAAKIMLGEGDKSTFLMKSEDIPSSENGFIYVNLINAMAAAALGWAMDIPISSIRLGLGGFHNNREDNPGRFSWLKEFPCPTLLDFGHNPEGVIQMCRYIKSKYPKRKKILVSNNIGSRHFDHIAKVAPIIVQTFDTVLFSYDKMRLQKNKDLQGRPLSFFLEYFSERLIASGYEVHKILGFHDYSDTFTAGYNMAGEDDVLVYLTDPWEFEKWQRESNIPLKANTV